MQAIGAHFVSESGGDPRYTTRIAGDCGADGSVSLAAGDDKTCIITNETSFDMADILITSAPDTMPAPSGQGTVTIRVRNSGTTTWQQGPAGNYAVRIGRTGRISLPVNLFVLTDAVAPNEEKTFTFTVLCNGVGLGGFSAQMANPSGTLFDLYAGKNILCQ